MNDYVGLKLRSEDMMRAGIKYLDDLKAYAKSDIGCEDAHQLMRTMELFDLIDLAKAVAITRRNRKESRCSPACSRPSTSTRMASLCWNGANA